MSKTVIALDIGGTNTRVALVDEEYNILAEVIRDTVRGSTEDFLESVASIIEAAVPNREGVLAIAAGVPGRVRVDGHIDALPNIGIENIPLASFLSQRFGLPAFILNDAEVASRSEANVGPLKNHPSLYFVTISTGVGGALTRGGKLIHSSYEVGHTMTSYHGSLYEFEHLASGTGLVRLSGLNGLSIASAKDFFSLVEAKDPLALRVYADWISLLGEWFSMVQEAFHPDVFALTGGVMKSADLFFEDLRLAAKGCRLERAGCGQRAGLLGAAVYGFQQVK